VAGLLEDYDLVRVCERESTGQKPDFRSPRHSVEVKELASPALRSYLVAQQRHIGDIRHYEVESLRETWAVSTDVSLAISSFEPATATPTVSSLIRSLTPLIERLEANGVADARMDPEIWPAIASLIHYDGACSVIAKGPYPPGILMIGHGYGHARTTDLEADVVAFLQDWITSSHADNARQSLAGENGFRCVVLVASMDGPASAMIRTLAENPGSMLRTPMRLPDEIDAVVVITDDEVLDYGLADGWRRRPIVA
jgi:hypothetical protein